MVLDFGVQIYNDLSGTDTKLVLKYDILADCIQGKRKDSFMIAPHHDQEQP